MWGEKVCWGGGNLYLSMSTQSCPQPSLVKLHTFLKNLSTRLGLAIYQNLGPPYFFLPVSRESEIN